VIKQNTDAEYAIVAQIDSAEEQQEPKIFWARGRCLELLLKEDEGR
jgi:hypothetical protein